MRVENFVSHAESEFFKKINDLKSSDYKPTVAIVFADPKFDYSKISSFLKEEGIVCFGASSAGEINAGETLENSITTMLLDIDANKFKFILKEVPENGSYKTGLEVADFGKKAFSNPSFITCFGMNINGEEIITGIEEVCGDAVKLYGGMASNVVEEGVPYIFSDGKKYKNAIAFLILDGDSIEINGFAIHGWEPIGGTHTITKASYNEIFEIDGAPALDVFEKFFGFFKDPLSKDKVSTVNSQYPMQVLRKGELIMRAPLTSNNDKKSLMMAGPVAEGEQFKFSIAPGFEVIDSAISKFKEFKEKIEQPDGMVLFSCKARHWSFGPMVEKENEALNELWEVPFAGFFTFGEIGKNENKSVNFYNETCCLVTFKEIV